MVLESISRLRISFIRSELQKCRRAVEKDQLLAARPRIAKSSLSGKDSRLTVREAGKYTLAWVVAWAGVAVFALVCLSLELVVG